MKATGTLTFTRNPDGAVSHAWKDGRIIELSYPLIVELGLVAKAAPGAVVEVGGCKLRLLTVAFSEDTMCFRAAWLAMQDGPMARLYYLYGKWVYLQALKYKAPIPRWSLTGMLLRWV